MTSIVSRMERARRYPFASQFLRQRAVDRMYPVRDMHKSQCADCQAFDHDSNFVLEVANLSSVADYVSSSHFCDALNS